MKISCTICDWMIEDTHPTYGEGWDICKDCRARIVDAKCQDIPMYCACCHKPLHEKDYQGTFNMVGNSTHPPGKFWVFKCGKCEGWTRCHESTELSFVEAMKQVEEQRAESNE